MTDENAKHIINLNDLVDTKTYAKTNGMDFNRLRRYIRKTGVTNVDGAYKFGGKRGTVMIDKNVTIVLPKSIGRGGRARRGDGRQRYVVYATQSEIDEINGWATGNVVDVRARAKTRRDRKREIADADAKRIDAQRNGEMGDK